MLHKEFWGLIFLAFVGWIFLASDGSTRIARACRPVGWAGNMAVSLTALAVPSQQSGVKQWVDKTEYGCQYTAWRLFFQDDYNKALQQLGQPDAPAPATALATAPPAAPGAGEAVAK